MVSEVRKLICTHDCPDACAVSVTVENGVAVDVRANSKHPITGRHLCPKVDRYLDRVYSPDRLLTPLRRSGPKGSGLFDPVGWEVALDEITDRWSELIGSDGAEAILPYSYLGSMGVLSAFGTMDAFFARLGATNLERTICGGQRDGLAGFMGIGYTDPERIQDSELIVVWGMDPVSTSIHTWDLIRRARKKGAFMVVVDPYRSRTAQRADLHVQLNPGTDAALALAMMHQILAENLADEDYVARFTNGIDGLRDAVVPWTAADAETVTGVPADVIVGFARQYATTKPAMIRHGIGMQRSAGAGTALRAIWCLPALCGQWRHPAGGIADARSFPFNFAAIRGPASQTRTLNMIQLGRILCDPDLNPPIRSLFVWNSNPAVIAADQNRVLKGLSREDLFTVVHDQFLTDTARYADLVLPAATMLEHQEVLGSWGFNYIGINEQAIEPLGESVSNSELARRLAATMGFDEELFQRTDDELIDVALSSPQLQSAGNGRSRIEEEGFLRVGPSADHAPFAAGGFPTEDGRFEFTAQAFEAAGLPPTLTYVPPYESPESDPERANRFPLRLLTLKRHWSINSSYGGLPVLLRAEPEPTAELNPADADARGITEGDDVVVWNDRGELTLRAAVHDGVMAGTVAVPFGRWLGDSSGANALTSDRLGDMGNGPTFCDNLVEVAHTASPQHRAATPVDAGG